MRYSLIVKGNANEARSHAELRGFRNVNIMFTSKGTTTLECDHARQGAPGDWFNDGNVRAPFPVGTLLHFAAKGSGDE